MVFDEDFEELKSNLLSLYSELKDNFEDEKLIEILDIKTGILNFRNIYLSKKKELDHKFLYYSIKCILRFLLIMKDDYKENPDYLKELNNIFYLWQIGKP